MRRVFLQGIVTGLLLGVLALTVGSARWLSVTHVPSVSSMEVASGVYWINVPHPVKAVNVVEWETVSIPRGANQVVDLLAVEGWMEPPYLQNTNAGHTKLGVLLRGAPYPADVDFHQSRDPDIAVILSVAGFKTNPASPDGQGVGLFQEWVRWEPPMAIQVPEIISLAFNTTNHGAILHGRVWYRVR